MLSIALACTSRETGVLDLSPTGSASPPGDAAAPGEPIPCTDDGTCSKPEPYCNQDLLVCVECLGDPNCSDGKKPRCLADESRCVECLESLDCTGNYPVCDVAEHRCVECLAPEDCPVEEACNPARKRCVPRCTTSAECAEPTGYCAVEHAVCVACVGDANSADPKKPRCSLEVGECVACLSDTDCVMDQKKPVCDTERNACVECTSGEQCESGACKTDGYCEPPPFG
jgi:hypothetical protein